MAKTSVRLKLETTETEKDFFSGSALIGISAAVQGYRFCWLVNASLETDFVRDAEQTLSLKKKNGTFHFPTYVYNIPHSGSRHLLYKLKDNNESLLPEAKQLDYLWMVYGETAEEDALLLLLQLRQMPDITFVQMLDTGQLKNLSNLLI